MAKMVHKSFHVSFTQVFPNANILCNHNTIIKTKKLTLIQRCPYLESHLFGSHQFSH